MGDDVPTVYKGLDLWINLSKTVYRIYCCEEESRLCLGLSRTELVLNLCRIKKIGLSN